MTPMTGRSRNGTGRFVFQRRQAGVVAGSLTLAVALAFASVVSPTRAIDGSADPSASGTPAASSEPSTLPSPTASPVPTDPPTLPPDPSPTPIASESPSASPGGSPPASAAESAPPGASPAPSASPPPEPAPVTVTTAPEGEPGLVVDHTWIDTIVPRTMSVEPGAPDLPATGIDRVRLFAVRFRVVNRSSQTLTLEPVLQFGPGRAPSYWTTLPAPAAVDGLPFYSSPLGEPAGAPTTGEIGVADLRMAVGPLPDGKPVPGAASAGLNPGPSLVLPPGSFTEVTFTIRATEDAAWLASYGLRLGNSGGTVTGATAVLTMRDSGLVAPLVRLGPSPYVSPHLSFTLISDTCGACHRTHAGSSTMLINQAAPEAALCFSCHDGSGSVLETETAFLDAPANDPGTASWYSHPAATDAGHLPGRIDEFSDRLNRHATCTDCHQPHRADGTLAAEGGGGWSASGAIAGASGVSVSFGAGGPQFSLVDSVTLEYELCLKCHSAFTTPPDPDPAHPSRWALDKGAELDPGNGSYHPIAGPGTNLTGAMEASLLGGTLWQFAPGDRIRCTNCHGDPLKALPGATTAPDARLAPHASSQRGILIAAYRDRLLKPAGEAFAETDFTLCFLCHSSDPFTSESSAATNFGLHALHLSGIGGESTGIDSSDIDLAGAGPGNAICAECHFRLHSTAFALYPGDIGNSRLVNFAPNVEPFNDVLEWSAADGTCTLTCHGKPHQAESY